MPLHPLHSRALHRAAWWLLAIAITIIAPAVFWLMRDPEPYMRARHSTIASIDSTALVHDGNTVERELTLTASNGLRVAIAVRRPVEDVRSDSTASQRRPLYLILGGHRRGMGAGALVGDTRGSIVASLDYPFEGNERAKGIAVVAEVPSIRRAFHDTPPAVLLALDYLLSRPDVDPARVELVGASFGAPFATIAAALDTRVTRLWLVHAGGEPFTLIENGLRPSIAFAPARQAVAALATLLASGPRFAPEAWVGRVAPRPVVMINARDDERIPRRAVDVLWARVREPRQQSWLDGRHVQGNRPEVLRALVNTIMEYAASDPAP
jgi:hypothetical protein